MSASYSENEIVIRPSLSVFSSNLRELWHFRELVWFLALREILVKYKQTVIGIAWTLVQPVLTMIVFTLIFRKIAKLPSGGVPYPLFIFAALLPWQFFASALTQSSNSIINNKNIISKVYFPRLIVPTSAVIAGLIDFGIALGVFMVMMLCYGVLPPVQIVFFPLFILLAFFFALGAGLWLSALNAEFKDVFYIVPFLVQVGLFLSPVGYSTGLIPERFRFFYALNPMVGVIDGFRWSLLGVTIPHVWDLVASVLIVFFLFLSGIFYFEKTSRTFADYL